MSKLATRTNEIVEYTLSLRLKTSKSEVSTKVQTQSPNNFETSKEADSILSDISDSTSTNSSNGSYGPKEDKSTFWEQKPLPKGPRTESPLKITLFLS